MSRICPFLIIVMAVKAGSGVTKYIRHLASRLYILANGGETLTNGELPGSGSAGSVTLLSYIVDQYRFEARWFPIHRRNWADGVEREIASSSSDMSSRTSANNGVLR